MLREVGDAGETGRDHLELAGPRIDMERAARLSGSRFAYLLGRPGAARAGAGPLRARASSRAKGFEPVSPPVLVRERALYGTGFLPDTEQQIYRLADDDLFLVGTSEVALASLHDDEILAGGAAPASGTRGSRPASAARPAPPARTRAGSSASTSSTRSRCSRSSSPRRAKPSTSACWRSRSRSARSSRSPTGWWRSRSTIWAPRRPRSTTFEAWLPGQGRYRELTSCSNTTDYQARRLDIRYRPGGDGRPEHVHTLNGTAVTSSRTIIALLENGQQPDGSVVLPGVLVGRGTRAAAASVGS